MSYESTNVPTRRKFLSKTCIVGVAMFTLR
ncbi:twin-arginine translocation signal domain-containing protein [Paenibacillus medicaginis]|uniref:Twin-arginine translocation signal domain-containing protein n=1 Tax=Paenibacillus medicaginis TaxID=1470560 RepID=A0ABV5C0P6_9BACL